MRHLKLIMVICFVFVTMAVSSQELSRQVISASGGQSEVGSLDLSWTMGQAGLVGTFTSPGLTLCAGFQQFDVLIDGITEQVSDGNLRVYPNPFNDFIVLEMITEQKASLTLKLFDGSGKLWLTKEIHQQPTVINETIDMSGLPHGIYYLSVLVDTQNKISTNQTIKLIH